MKHPKITTFFIFSEYATPGLRVGARTPTNDYSKKANKEDFGIVMIDLKMIRIAINK